jgi:hypothetical protein
MRWLPLLLARAGASRLRTVRMMSSRPGISEHDKFFFDLCARADARREHQSCPQAQHGVGPRPRPLSAAARVAPR